jgi:hypothetical protein
MGVGSNLFRGDGHRILLRGRNRFRVADSPQNRFLCFTLFNHTIKVFLRVIHLFSFFSCLF